MPEDQRRGESLPVRRRMALRLIYKAAIASWKTLLRVLHDPQAREWRRLKKERLRQESIFMEVTRCEEEARLCSRRGERPG